MIWNDLKNRSKKCTVTFVGGSSGNQTVNAGIRFYIDNEEKCSGSTSSETVIVPAGTVVQCRIGVNVTSYFKGRVYVNNELVAEGAFMRELSYEYSVTSDATITRSMDASQFPTFLIVNIVESGA